MAGPATLDYAATSRGQSRADLVTLRDQLISWQNDYVVDLGNTQTRTGRDAIIRRIDALDPQIAEAKRKIAVYDRTANRIAARRALLNDYLTQYHLYLDALCDLDLHNPAHLPLMKSLLRRVGAQFTLGRDERGKITVHVDLTLTPQVAQPWFTPEQLAAFADSGTKPVSPTPKTPADAKLDAARQRVIQRLFGDAAPTVADQGSLPRIGRWPQ